MDKALYSEPKQSAEVTYPNQIWCGDVRFIWVGARWDNLVIVTDLFSRRPSN